MFGGAMAPHCVCDKNFFGPACAGSCTVQDCGGHGVCGHDVDKKFAHCFCNTGYDGVDCTKSVRTSRDRAVHALSTLRSSHPPPFALSLSHTHTHTHTYTTHSLTQGTGGAVFIESGLEKVLAAPDIQYPPVQVS